MNENKPKLEKFRWQNSYIDPINFTNIRKSSPVRWKNKQIWMFLCQQIPNMKHASSMAEAQQTCETRRKHIGN